MRSRYKIVDSEGVYFLTATVIEWIPSFIPRSQVALGNALVPEAVLL